MKTRLSKTEKIVLRETARRSFWFYFLYVFGVYWYCKRRPDNDWIDPVVHKKMCKYFQKIILWWFANRKDLDDRYIMLWAVPREGGKSITITSAGSSWCMIQDPNLSLGIGSYKADKAEDFLQPVKNMYEGTNFNGLFADLYGIWKGNDERKWKSNELVHAARTMREIREPSYQCIGAKGGSAGSRYDIYFFDDPIADRSSKDISTQLDSDIQAAVNHVRKMWPVIKKNGLWVIPLTRKADNDVFGYVAREFKVREFADTGMKPRKDDYVWDPKNGKVFVFFMSGRDGAGEATMPGIWSDGAMRSFEQRDPVNFASEIMNMPAEGVHVSLTQAHVDKMWVPRSQVPPNVRWTLHCDTAFKTREQAQAGDHNAIVLAAHAKDGSGDVYFMKCLMSNIWSSTEFYEQLVMMVQELHARHESVWCITDEKEVGGKEGLFAEQLAGHFHRVGLPMPRLITLRRKGKKKELRMSLAMDYWLQGKAKLVTGGENLKIMAHQYLRMNYIPEDDAADAAADAFHPDVYFGERMYVGLTADLRARRPLDMYAHVPLHMMGVQDKVHRRQEMQAQTEKALQAERDTPWWHNKGHEW